ncbi:MAG: hypothetical protein E7452_06560 [Ruminococcaceae bacterium]|nr:hypothetical protein [Oscillospiraceae bacterium]
MKNRTFLLALLLMLFCLAGCGSNEPAETDLPESPERPAKTDAVALIPQDGVVEIEDETGTYEVVYAEDLKEIRMDEDTNVLVSADDENFVYTFENADLVLSMMREGDVFCGILPDSGEALAIVVREIEKNGDSVTVYGVQPTLADLFETIEIEATYAPETIVVDELAEGAIIEEKAIDPSLASDRAPRAMNLAAGPFSKGEPKRIPPDHTISLGISVEADRAKVEGSISMTIETVNVSVEYRGGTMLTSVATVQTTTAFEAELAIQGGWEYDKPVGKFHIPTQIPLLTVPVSLNAYASISGSVGGKLSYQQTSVNGAEISVAGGDVAADDVDRVIRKNVDADFVNFQAEAKIGAKVAVGLSLCRGVFEAELSALVGLKAEAEYAPFEPWDEFADSCHDCGICFDGEFSAFGEIAYDVTVAFPMSTPINVGATLVEVTVPINDFYVSLGPDGRAAPRFGLGECPYRRYRTEVKVTSKYGEIYGAEVFAQYPDGRSEMKWTDEFGYAVFWLPAGQNWLDTKYNERVTGDYYPIAAKPGKVELELEFDQRVVIACNFLDTDYSQEHPSAVNVIPEAFGDIYEQLVSKYPQAEIYGITDENYNAFINTWWDGITVFAFTLYKYREFLPELNLRPGDILVCLTVNHDKMVTDGYALDGRNSKLELPPYEYDGYGWFRAKVYMAVNSWEDETELYTIGDVGYSLETDRSTSFLPEVHWLKAGGEERVLTRVYFKGTNDSGYMECTDFFDEISYSFDDVYYESAPEIDYWTGREVLETDLWEWDAQYNVVVSHTREKNYYYEENYNSWGDALISYSMDCLISHIDRALIH